MGNGCPDDLTDADLFFPSLGRKGSQPEKAEAGDEDGEAGEMATENSYPDLRSIEALVVFVQVIILESRPRVYGYSIIFPFIRSKKNAL